MNVLCFVKLLVLFEIHLMEGCMGTAGSDEGTISACATCDPASVGLVPGNNRDSITPTVTNPVAGTDGCLRMTTTCDASHIPNGYTFMEFQNSLGGPTAEMVSVINATLVCMHGAWTYTQSGVTTEITQVNCALGFLPNCATCNSEDVVFTSMTGEGTASATSRGPTTDADGCLTLTAICPTSPNGGPVFMQFNMVIGGPQNPTGGEITADLQCVNGEWKYIENGVATTITEINCIAA